MENFPEAPFPELIDSSKLSTFDSCEAKFYFSYIHHLSPLAISPDLHAGAAFSTAMEVARTAIYKHSMTTEEAIAQGVRAMVTYWGDFEPPHGHNKTLEAMIGALASYFEEYPPETDPLRPLIKENGEPAVEFSFSIPTLIPHPVSGDPIMYCGRFDMLADFDGMFLCVEDDKTTKSFYMNWAESWHMRGQFMGYCYAAQQHGYDVSRALIRGIAILKTKYNHAQAIVEFQPWMIEKWWQDTNRKIERMVSAWKNDHYIRSFADACSAYSGCEFKPHLCINQYPEQHLNQFQIKEWNPLEKNPTWPLAGPKYETIGNFDELKEEFKDGS